MPFINALTKVAPANGTGAGATDKQHAGYSPFFEGLKPGQNVQATVRARLPGGEFVVALGEQNREEKQLLHLKLPHSAQAGDLLDLVFISRDPRPAFMLKPNTPTAVSVPLSETGRFIDGLVRRLISPGSPPALTGTEALLEASPVDSVQLARNLANALTRSGLFYEAHLAQWMAGARPLAELLLEPQARLSPQQMHARDSDFLPNTTPSAGDNAAPDNASNVRDPVHPEALALVRQQLEIFETRHVTWQGLAWPGQPVEWEVAEEKHEPGDEREEASSTWNTLLRITLPNLGHLSACIRLNEGGVEIQLVAADPVTAFILRTGAIPLANGLEAAGIKLLGMEVDLNAQT